METVSFLPIRTRRTIIRSFATTDIDAFAAYRNHPEIARYQDWALPFSTDDARVTLGLDDGRTHCTGEPRRDDWVNVAVTDAGDDRLLGDVAIGLDASGTLATIGYTLAPVAQGRGYATEAVAAVVERLFDREVHRISATVDPDNVASARVLERLGFRYEGRSVAAAHVRGAWLDDDRYAVLADEWRQRAPAIVPPNEVTLVELDADNVGSALALETHHSQRHFVATVAESIADAMFPEEVDGAPVVPWLRMVLADGVPAGFVMLAERTTHHPHPYLWRLLIDRRHQRRGIGRSALAAVGRRLADHGDELLFTSWVPGRGGPAGFYERLGFVPTGEIDDGEVVASVPVVRLFDR